MLHYTSVRGVTPHYVDTRVLAGHCYRYCVKAYDFAGNRSPESDRISITVPLAIEALTAEAPSQGRLADA